MKKTSMQLVYELLKSGLPPEQVVNYLLIDEELMLEKEKEQIINANRDGVDMVVDKNDFISGEQYYNETYNKQ